MSTWRPSASLSMLATRSAILQKIRTFFAARNVLEVETPLLMPTSVTDPYIQSVKADGGYLQTSPEYAMKRLLAAGSGDIFQLCKAFRKEEQGPWHNIEFTMLEWYRLGFDHHALMDEVEALLQMILQMPAAERLSYSEAFKRYCDIEVQTATDADLRQCAKAQEGSGTTHRLQRDESLAAINRDTWLRLLIWMAIGMLIYYFYSRHHSKIRLSQKG